MVKKAKAFWAGCVSVMLVAGCVAAPTATTTEGKAGSRRTTPTGTKATPRPSASPGQNDTTDPDDTTTDPDPTATDSTTDPDPTATDTADPNEPSFFAKVVENGVTVSGADISGFPGTQTNFDAPTKTAKSDANGLFEMKASDNAPMNVLVVSGTKKALKFGIAGDSAKNTFTLQTPGTITGKVSATGVTDLTAVEVGIPGTNIKTDTDSTGNYTLTGVPVGTYTLKATRGNIGSGNLASVAVTAGGTKTGANITLSTNPPTVSSISPTNGGDGVEVTITGTNFGTDPAKVSVTFAGVTATPTSVTDTQIKVNVPADTVNGDVVVTANSVASNGKAFKAVGYLYFEVDKRTLFVGDEFTYKVIARDTDDAAIANPTITNWTKTGTAFSLAPATNKLSAVVTATGGGEGLLKVLSGTEFEEIPIVVDATTVNVSTVAGNGTTGATATTLLGPTGITGDGTNFYIADQNESGTAAENGSRIRKLVGTTLSNYAGKATNAFANHATDPTQAEFQFPRNLALDGNNLYVADMANNMIRHIDIPSGEVTTLVGVSQTLNTGDYPESNDTNKTLCYPAAIAVASNGDLYFTEWHRNAESGRTTGKIRKYVPGTDTLTSLTLTGGVYANLNEPTGLAISADDSTLYVADKDNHLIKRITLATGAVTVVAGADPDADGVGIPGYLDGTGDIAEIRNPDGLAMDGMGRLYTSDASGYIREISFEGDVATVKTLAGSGTPADGFAGDFHADGSGSAAKFQLPAGVWVNSTGSEVYVADYQNKRIRKIVINRP